MTARGVVIVARDLELLAWVTRHGMVTADQVSRRFFSSVGVARRRLRRLQQIRLIRRDRAWWSMPDVVRVTEAGARLADVDLGAAPLDYLRLRHHLAVVDLSEELLDGNTGARWITEREVRRDLGRAAQIDRSVLRRRVPDGVLILTGPRRIAVELDLTPKRTQRLDVLVSAYATDFEVDAVWWYLPSETAVARMQELIRSRRLDRIVDARVRRVVRP